MTAVSNDIAYEECFAVPLKRFANPSDGLVTISSSGNSKNVIRAIETAKELKMKVITLSGMSPDNKSRKMGDLNFYIPADTYGIVEVNHQALLHCWLDRFMEISA
jgi:D-sedoheptulose 7-phosphate isomerase